VRLATQLTADLLGIVTGFLVALVLWRVDLPVLQRDLASLPWLDLSGLPPLLALGVLVGFFQIGTFSYLGLYQPRREIEGMTALRETLRAVALSALLGVAVLVTLDAPARAAQLVLLASALGVPVLLAARRSIPSLVARFRGADQPVRRALLCGFPDGGEEAARLLWRSCSRSLSIRGLVHDELPIGACVPVRRAESDPAWQELPVLGRSDELSDLIVKHEIDEVFLPLGCDPDLIQRCLESLRDSDARLSLLCRPSATAGHSLIPGEIGALQVIHACPGGSSPGFGALKRAFDFVAASLLLIVTAPISLLCALLIRLDSPGPILFTQERIGLEGRPFRILKFRTMRQHSDPYAPSPEIVDGARVTRVGRVLRWLSLDEIPQLINVLRGEMSLVGPRPEMPFIVERYGAAERTRLRAVPGMTGPWQVSGHRTRHIHEALEFDLFYLARRSFLLDLTVLWQTFVLVVDRLRDVLVQTMLRRP
jgi:exopolysaccharide biosynthesis polyprenyl glycosylphosphotransferase